MYRQGNTARIRRIFVKIKPTTKPKGRTMARNVKEIMAALDKILGSTVWVNGDRQIVSLTDELSIGTNGHVRSIEDLARASLIGAYVSLQIRSDNFDVPAESLETADLAAAVKTMVFTEAKKLLGAEVEQIRKAA
jgi:hypothetical protein